MPRVRSLVLALVAALASASGASADGLPPTITLVSPANSAAVPLDGKHNPTFAWEISFAQAQTSTTQIQLMVSADPNFLRSRYVETRICDTSTPACFTSTVPEGTYWISAATGSPSLPAKPVPLYWRVTLTWQAGQPPVTSAAGSFMGTPAAPDRTPPRIAVRATSAHRGSRARVRFQLADDSGTVTARARLLYHGATLLTTSRTFADVNWADQYYFWFEVPRRARTGRYTACIRATDALGNSAERCAGVTIR